MAKDNETNKRKATGASKTKYFIFIGSAVSIVIIAVLVIVIMTLLQREPEREPVIVEQKTGGRGMLVTEENLAEVLEKMSKPVEDGSYTVEMNSNWTFPSGSSESTNAVVANPTDNTRTVYFDVILTDTNELVYSSPYMPVGSRLANFALDANLPAGVYSATVIYHLVDDDLNELTTASVRVTMNIER